MALQIFESENYAAFAHRGGGVSLRCLYSEKEVFFQPGDDANAFRDSIDALDEVNEDKRAVIFDMIASEYLF
jgi:hypothetical protein